MFKQVIIVRKDLNMSHGKMAAQVAHASNAFLVKMIKDNVIGEIFNGPGLDFMQPMEKYRIDGFDIDKGTYEEWINGVFTKTILEAKNKNQLMKVVDLAKELGLEENKDFFLIKDNCYTELTPEEIDENGVGRTLTCIGFRPFDSEFIDKIGKKYQLYKD